MNEIDPLTYALITDVYLIDCHKDNMAPNYVGIYGQ